MAIGASAGGLGALQTFFRHVPEDPGVAFVVIVHLSPDHESHLVELLRPCVGLPVEQVTGPRRLEADRVYVIAPNANLEVRGDELRPSRLEAERAARAPIDHFFGALADAHGGRAIGVVLTGTGSDGALGLRHIRERGGLTLVQDPEEAEYDGMPRSAIGAAKVDLVLPVGDIPAAALGFARTEPRLVDEDVRGEPVLDAVIAQLRARTGRDLSEHDPDHLRRRIARRMQLHRLGDPSAYLRLLRSEPAEAHALADDLLVAAGRFFRDPEAFEHLARHVLPGLFGDDRGGDRLRAWSVDCGTGEEAYSLAILLLEEAARRPGLAPVQVFASDLHAPSLAVAREGFYHPTIAADVGPGRLARFFRRERDGYRIGRAVRDVVVFAPHDVLVDPPFSRLDLVSCRHRLSHLRPNARRRLVERFHYALRPGGVLLLGRGETIDAGDLFEAVDEACGVHRRREATVAVPRAPSFRRVHVRNAGRLDEAARHADAYGELRHRMLDRFGPPSVLVSPDDRVVHLSDRAGRFLVHHAGALSASVGDLVRDELRGEVCAALSAARARRAPVRTRALPVRLGDSEPEVIVDVRPGLGAEQDGFALLIFEERDPPAAAPLPEADDAALHARRSHDAKIQTTLRAIIREKEASEEALSAANEELRSANEELRSTMEELEVGKEQLESANEELRAMTQENRFGLEELDRLTSDLEHLLATTDIAMLFLDRALRIQRFTPRAGDIFHVRATDRGRPLSDLSSSLEYDGLDADAQAVLERSAPVEREIRDDAGRWFLMRVLPQRGPEGRAVGVLLTLIDVTERKRAEEALRASQEQRYRTLFESIDEGFCIVEVLLDAEGAPHDYRFLEVNPAFHTQTGMGDVVGRRMREIAPGHEPGWYEIFGRVARTGESVRFQRRAENLGRFLDVNAFRIGEIEERRVAILVDDITERIELEDRLRAVASELEQANRRKDEYLAMLGHELRNPLAAMRNATALLQHARIDDPDLRRAREVLGRQSAHMVRLVDGLLDVSRIARGKVELELRPTDLREVLRRVLEDRAPQIAEKGLALSTDLAPEPLWVDGDETRLVQIFDNLVGNALKFTPAPGSITATLARDDGQAVVGVRDTGAGIRPEMLDRVFEAFQQEPQDGARSAGGLGLGLALAKGLTELHHGTIRAQSDGGGGAFFEVRLPLIEPPTEPARPRREARGPSRRILVVEDNADAAEMLRHLLARRGHDVAVAETGEDALDWLHEHGAEVVLCDLGLPDMSGNDVARAVRDDPALRAVTLVALTGYGAAEDRRRTTAAGFDGHLVKPVDLGVLDRLLRELPPTRPPS